MVEWCCRVPQHAKKARNCYFAINQWGGSETQDHYHQTHPHLLWDCQEGEGTEIFHFSSYRWRTRCRMKSFLGHIHPPAAEMRENLSCGQEGAGDAQISPGMEWHTWGLFCWVSCSAEAADLGPSLFSSCSDPGALKLFESWEWLR